MEVDGNVLVCPSWSVKHRIKPEMAGKRAKCKCGTILEIPTAPKQAAPEEEDLYGIADTPNVVTKVAAPGRGGSHVRGPSEEDAAAAKAAGCGLCADAQARGNGG